MGNDHLMTRFGVALDRSEILHFDIGCEPDEPNPAEQVRFKALQEGPGYVKRLHSHSSLTYLLLLRFSHMMRIRDSEVGVEVPLPLKRFLRICVLDVSLFDDDHKPTAWKDALKEIEENVESSTEWQILNEILRDIQGGYSTSADEDQKALDTLPTVMTLLNVVQHFTLTYRIAQKRLLETLIRS